MYIQHPWLPSKTINKLTDHLKHRSQTPVLEGHSVCWFSGCFRHQWFIKVFNWLKNPHPLFSGLYLASDWKENTKTCRCCGPLGIQFDTPCFKENMQLDVGSRCLFKDMYCIRFCIRDVNHNPTKGLLCLGPQVFTDFLSAIMLSIIILESKIQTSSFFFNYTRLGPVCPGWTVWDNG